jgi:hypothetical protein
MRNFIVAIGAIALFMGYASLGSASETLPTVRDFLATCAKVTAADEQHAKGHVYSDAFVDCTNVITAGSMARDGCAPPLSTTTDDIRLAVVAWLKDRPQMFAMDEIAGAEVALKGLYCH